MGAYEMDRIGRLIKKASLELEKTALLILSRYDMTLTQYKILVYLYNAPPMSTRQVDLERAYSMTNPSVTSVLHTLEKKGLINRAENAKDRRSKVISLTHKALDLRDELEAAGDRLEEAFTRNLSSAERSEMVVLLTKMLKKG